MGLFRHHQFQCLGLIKVIPVLLQANQTSPVYFIR
jgi:hypothetical protein